MADLSSTSRRLRDLGVRRATLIVDRDRAEANIARYAARAAAAGIVLRPHFKTHQSAGVAQWFRKAGITRAAVSSIGMARYFADHGWDDLTLAIPANPLEVEDYDTLAGRVALGLTIDSHATCDALEERLQEAVSLWIEVDTGGGRTGIAWDDHAALTSLALRLRAGSGRSAQEPRHRFAGLLTHGGQSYGARDRLEAAAIFATVRRRLQAAAAALGDAGLSDDSRRGTDATGSSILLSAGDTPGFASSADWSGLDEARPGNFVFHDLMQLSLGTCTQDDLACAVACPVIGVYPERHEAAVHAGAVHLSKEHLSGTDGRAIFGRLIGLSADGFTSLLPGWDVASLSQEHGLIAARTQQARHGLAAVKPGDLVLVAPVHACLTCEQFTSYLTLDGEIISRYRR
jgi:D-serine deaminase-like pyridoxal phosphate-dependent protein